MGPLPSSPGKRRSKHTQAQRFQWQEVGDRARAHLWGSACPPTAKAEGTVGLSAQGWSLSSLTLSPVPPPGDHSGRGGDPGEVSTTVLSLGEPLLTWTGPLLPGPAAPVSAGSGRWVVQGGGWGSRHIQPLSAFPSPAATHPHRCSGCLRL